jgi:hypothetical protein
VIFLLSGLRAGLGQLLELPLAAGKRRHVPRQRPHRRRRGPRRNLRRTGLLGVLQAVLARRHRSGTHPADKNPPPTGWSQHRARRAQDRCIRYSVRQGKSTTVTAAGQRKPPATPQDDIARPEPGPHYNNWSKPISRLV